MEVGTCFDSNTSSMYDFINYFLDVILPVFKYLNEYVPKSIIVNVNSFKGPSPTYMKCSETSKLKPNDVSMYLPKIILYLSLV